MLVNSTAIVCYNDELAVNLLRFCRENDIKVPDDVSVVGIDDSKFSTLCDVPLTTVHHPHKVLGERVARKLIEQMNAPEDDHGDVIFHPELIVRDSVRSFERR